jgi:chaperone modulatory protein CbpM
MMTFDVLLSRFTTLTGAEVERWIVEGHIRPDAAPHGPLFREVDVERLRLILELRDAFEVNEAALPVVLSLLDQVYALRREVLRLQGGGSADPAA